MSTEPEKDSTIPTVPNPRRLPTVELGDGVALFSRKTLLLGDAHVVDTAGGAVPCGAACPHRLASISCPYFAAPCLVGCTVKQVLIGEGMTHEEQEFFVVAQTGRYLVGQEVVINLDNPRAARLRVVKDKRGETVYADDELDGTLVDGIKWTDGDWDFLEGEHRGEPQAKRADHRGNQDTGAGAARAAGPDVPTADAARADGGAEEVHAAGTEG